MLERGAGAICTIGSELALCGDADAAHYAAAKGAIHALHQEPRRRGRAARRPRELRRARADRHAADDAGDARPRRTSTRSCSSRLVAPEEIAAAVPFVTRGAHNLVGQVISPNAGAVV